MRGSTVQSIPQPTDNPRRGWRFQYSLRTLHLVVLAVSIACVPFAMKMKAIRMEKAAKRQIERLGGKVTYFHRGDWSWLTALLGNESAPHFTYVDLSECHVDENSLGCLERFQELQSLALRQTPVTNDSLEHLSSLKDIAVLALDETAVSDAGLLHLEKLPKLESLFLDDTQVTDAGCAVIARMTAIDWVALHASKVTPAGVAWLRRTRPDIRVDYEAPNVLPSEENLRDSQESTP